jgi:hypothetical protein
MAIKSLVRSTPAIAALALSLASFGWAPSASAATQGTLGATSTGTISISASVPARARISGLVDVAFTNQDPASAASVAQDVCVWSNTATRGYSITASGDGTGSAFTLAGASTAVPYTVQWSSSSGQTSGTSLTASSSLAGLVSTATQQTCGAGPAASASLVVGMSAATLQSMQASTSYTGVMTLLVAPQ